MNAPHIDNLVAEVPAWPHRHRHCHQQAPGIAAQPVSGVRPSIAMPTWSRPRLAMAALTLSTCTAIATTGGPHTPDAATPKVADAQVALAVPVPTSASGSPDTSSSDLPLVLPLNAIPGHARPNIRPLLSDGDRLAALLEGKQLRSMPPGAVVVPVPPARSFQSALGKTTAPFKVSADGTAYALVTDVTRTRIASELRQQLMGSSATVGELPGTPHTELMQVSAGWRAVVWPFATESEADKARRMLAERGIRTELLKF